MIVDGKLVVSKKRKLDLVKELKDKGFKAIPKVAEPLKEGELEPIADDDEDEEDQEAVEAADYDYLLGMPIWSLTKERVEKLLRQVGDVEQAIDALIKLSKEALWKHDLDEFIEEWRFQLEDEHKSRKKMANMGRRASTKLKIGGVIERKRKANGNGSDDSDFAEGPKVKKTAAPKAKGGILGEYFGTGAVKAVGSQKTKAPSAAAKNAQKLLGMLDSNLKPASQLSREEDVWLQAGELTSHSQEHATQKASAGTKKPAPKLAAKPIAMKKQTADAESAGEDTVQPAAGRKPRAAAAKPPKYANLSDSDSDGDNMLFNVGNMVKGISTDATNIDTSRPLFSTTQSRPGSSTGLAKRPSSSHKLTADIDADETDYSKLAPPTTKKGPAVTARQTIISDEDDSFDELPIQKASKPNHAPKAAAKPKIPAKKPGAAASTQPKQMPLSPAAKAYAAKKAKAEKAAQEAEKKDLDVDTVANEILDDEEKEDEVCVRRPARRAAAAVPKKKWVVSDDEDDEDEETADFDGDDSDD